MQSNINRKRFFEILHGSIPISSKKTRLIAREQIIKEEFKGYDPINISSIIQLPWFAENIVKYVYNPEHVVKYFSKSKHLILHALEIKSTWNGILETEFGLRPHDPSTILRPTGPRPVVMLQNKKGSAMYTVFELNKDIPLSRVCVRDMSKDHPFVKILALRGYKQQTGNMPGIVKKTIDKNEPFKYGRRLSNIERNSPSTLNNYLNHNGVVFFEQYGYTVNDGVLEKATTTHLLKFAKSMKRWKRSLKNLDWTIINSTENNMKIIRSLRMTGIHEFSEVIKYVIDECKRRGWITEVYSKSLMDLHRESLIIRSSDVFISNILSHILPKDLIHNINSTCATSWLYNCSKKKDFSIETLKCLIDSGASISSDHQYNERMLITDVIKTNNLPVFNYLLELGVGTDVDKFPDYLKKSIRKFLGSNF